ncbi:restriction endonuclease subunit S [Vibrio sp. 1-Bac 57]
MLLKEIANIKAGHPFRGAIKEDSEGNGFVIQVKNINGDSQVDWENLIKAHVSGRNEPEWLKTGDIVFVSRGPRITAAAIDTPVKQAVCSQHFFVINVTSEQVDPEFLAWQLNQLPVQNYFQQTAEGSAQVSIRRSVLEETPLAFPDLATQRKVMAVVKCALKEKQVHLKLIENRKQQLAAITQNLLK